MPTLKATNRVRKLGNTNRLRKVEIPNNAKRGEREGLPPSPDDTAHTKSSLRTVSLKVSNIRRMIDILNNANIK